MKPSFLKNDTLRYVLLGAVAAAPLILFAVLRPRSGIDVPALVWAELPAASPRAQYAPRTAVFDGARRTINLGAARGETVAFLIRAQGREPLGGVSVEVKPMERRGPNAGATGAAAPPLTLNVRQVTRAAGGDGALGPVVPGSLAAGSQAEWLVEITVPEGAAPGSYAAPLRVRGGGDTLERFGVMLSVWRTSLPACAPRFDGADRAAAWRAFSNGSAAPVSSCAAAVPATTLSAVARREAEDDLRHLQLLRAQGNTLVEQVVRRAIATPPTTADAWDALRRELVGLLNAAGR